MESKQVIDLDNHPNIIIDKESRYYYIINIKKCDKEEYKIYENNREFLQCNTDVEHGKDIR